MGESNLENAQEANDRAAFVWNSVSGILVAFQSVVILMVVSHACGPYEAGVYTIAYATANLFLYVGNYGMRQFQASDRASQFGFASYHSSRVITCAAMIIVSVLFIAVVSAANAYSFEKALTVLVMCLFKLVDAAEDVYHGEYQRLGRLDVAARLLSARMFTTIALICVLVVVFNSLLPALIVSTVYTVTFLVLEIAYVRIRYGMPDALRFRARDAFGPLRSCFPLFLAAFLLFYVGNAPRWAIDASMNDASQALFGYIMMPNFVVTLLASFVYNPMIASMADEWMNGNPEAFLRKFAMIACAVVGITVVCALGAWLIGVPVLDVLFATGVSEYLFELVLLVAGGGFLALLALATLGIAIIRMQSVLVVAYCPVAVCAFLFSPWAVGCWGITGASWVYFLSMMVLAVVFSCCFVLGVKSPGVLNAFQRLK